MPDLTTLIRDLHTSCDRPEELRVHVAATGAGLRLSVHGYDGPEQVLARDDTLDETSADEQRGESIAQPR